MRTFLQPENTDFSPSSSVAHAMFFTNNVLLFCSVVSDKTIMPTSSSLFQKISQENRYQNKKNIFLQNNCRIVTPVVNEPSLYHLTATDIQIKKPKNIFGKKSNSLIYYPHKGVYSSSVFTGAISNYLFIYLVLYCTQSIEKYLKTYIGAKSSTHQT